MIGVSSVGTTLVRDAVEAPPAVSHIIEVGLGVLDLLAPHIFTS